MLAAPSAALGSAPVSVIIPVYRGAAFLRRLLPALARQDLPPSRILVIDSSSDDGSAAYAAEQGCRVHTIPKADFNHGGTRNLGARLALAEAGGTHGILVFMTQDAVPEDQAFLARLIAPLRSGEAVLSYARQVAHPDAWIGERFGREALYGPQRELRRPADMPRLGARAFFCSNVAAAVRADDFLRLGGFPEDVIMCEDRVLCARVLAAGGSVAYCADAVVRHSHDYTTIQQFRRYFDNGVFQRDQDEPARGLAGDGLRFALGQWLACWRSGGWKPAARSALHSAAKLLGLLAGRRYHWIPVAARRRLSLHAYHWQQRR